MLAKILGGLSALLAMVVLFLRGSLAKEKQERAEELAEQRKASHEASDKATEALIKGMSDEAKDTSSRDHDFTK